jgi:hypothetical protein
MQLPFLKLQYLMHVFVSTQIRKEEAASLKPRTEFHSSLPWHVKMHASHWNTFLDVGIILAIRAFAVYSRRSFPVVASVDSSLS